MIGMDTCLHLQQKNCDTLGRKIYLILQGLARGYIELKFGIADTGCQNLLCAFQIMLTNVQGCVKFKIKFAAGICNPKFQFNISATSKTLQKKIYFSSQSVTIFPLQMHFYAGTYPYQSLSIIQCILSIIVPKQSLCLLVM